MSLILDALKKLDREKGRSSHGFLVITPSMWTERKSSLLLIALGMGLGAIVLAAVGLGGWLWLRHPGGAHPPQPAGESAGPASPAMGATPIVRPRLTPLAVPIPLPSRAPAVAPAEPEANARSLGAAAETRPRPPSPPPGTPTPTPALYRLNAISERDGKPIAMLNDRLVQEGDKFDGLTVVRIGQTEVEIEVNGKRLIVGF